MNNPGRVILVGAATCLPLLVDGRAGSGLREGNRGGESPAAPPRHTATDSHRLSPIKDYDRQGVSAEQMAAGKRRDKASVEICVNLWLVLSFIDGKLLLYAAQSVEALCRM